MLLIYESEGYEIKHFYFLSTDNNDNKLNFRLPQFSKKLRNYLVSLFIPLDGQFWTQNDQDL